MFRKIGITITVTGILILSAGTGNIFAAKPDCPDDYKDKRQAAAANTNATTEAKPACPDDCKCGPDVNCKDAKCEKETTNTCICKPD
ncbi:MAG: hypothetical protein L3J17_07950 [Candidatus Jettenia sp.]|nr:MAG: hypothetical protein L3J17_07950 [Candidatus Jettenia sp.]